jgi:NAD+ diphosphatase
MQRCLESPYFIDRASVCRERSEWLAAESAGGEVLVAAGSQLLTRTDGTGEPLWVKLKALSEVLDEWLEPIFLGQVDGRSYFVVAVPQPEQAKQVEGAFDALFEAYLAGVAMAQTRLRDVYALAAFMGFWHRRHQLCGSCGRATCVENGGHLRRCSEEACGQQFFPSMDPAVIVLIEHEEHCLLGRQSRWPDAMYSVLAGFVEPGESLEAAVAREVHEEVGLVVEEITYHSSQSWLFPNSLMLGFTARALSTQLDLSADELEAADWYSREYVRAHPEMLPRSTSIAYRLIQDWLARGE